MRIDLTDSEWMSILDQERYGLPACCANISALRDDVFSIVRNGCETADWQLRNLAHHFYWCFPSHEPAFVMTKLFDQFMQDEMFTSYYTSIKEHNDTKEREITF